VQRLAFFEELAVAGHLDDMNVGASADADQAEEVLPGDR
jgi:hypothetical protein